jgi:drug/metabolite transporter (DMT)-like permease
MDDQRRALLFAFTSVCFWSTVAVAFKLSLRYLTVIELLLLATLLSTIVLGVILLAQSKFKQVFACSYKEYLLSLMLGFLNPFLYYLILFKAYELLPAQQAQPINYTWAIMLSVLSVPFLKQKITARQGVALIGGYLGVVVIATKGQLTELDFTSPFGVFLAIFSTVIWALYWIFNTRESRDPVVGLFVNFCFSLPFIVLYYLWVGEFRPLPLEGILGAAYIGAFEMGICFVLWLKAMKLTNSTAQISSLIFLSPFMSLILISYFLGETIEYATLVGLVLIVASILYQNKGSSVSNKTLKVK